MEWQEQRTIRLPVIPITRTDLRFQFKRVQFPLKTAFAVNINEVQGQTLNVAGVHLEKNYFFFPRGVHTGSSGLQKSPLFGERRQNQKSSLQKRNDIGFSS